ncbi:MAG: S41 family peptidase [Spirochaetales bacterium]|nr:S41 family peptidase [Spirochaetales bacterium]
MENNTLTKNKKAIFERILVAAIVIVFSGLIVLLSFSNTVLADSGDLTDFSKDDMELQEELALFKEVIKFVRENYVDESKVGVKNLMEGAFQGLFESLDDPHSAYLTATDMSDMEETTTGKFGGVGLYILKVENGIEVARPIDGTPAFRAGIQAGDLIIAVNGESVLELTIDEVVDRLKGEPRTDVTVTILRGKALKFDVTLTRAMIELPTVKRDMIMDDIAYLQIIQFTPLTYDRIVEAIEYFQSRKYRSLIIDLRSNPGGLLSSVINIADLFFPKGSLIVSTKSRIPNENREYLAKEDIMVPESLPIVVLIDKYSASASEILTGALKDTGRAYIIGEKSYGKGSVQQVRYAGDGGFRLTIAEYFTPSNITINKIGITPDKIVKEEELTEEEKTALNDLYEKKSVENFVEKTPHPTEKQVENFIKGLKREGIMLKDRYIKRLVFNQVNRLNPKPPVYDLDYDVVLQEAVWELRKDQPDEGNKPKK